jgi:hypothetical protein
MTESVDIAAPLWATFLLYSWASKCGAGSLGASVSGMLLSILTRKTMALLPLKAASGAALGAGSHVFIRLFDVDAGGLHIL